MSSSEFNHAILLVVVGGVIGGGLGLAIQTAWYWLPGLIDYWRARWFDG